MALRDKLIRILNEYGDIYDKVWRAQEFRDPLLDYFNADVKQAVQEIVQKYDSELLIDSSTGVGRTTGTPWITIMDKRITTRASQGTYVVYLFNKDKKSVYLALGRSSTEAIKIIEEKGYTGREKTKKVQEYIQEEKLKLLKALNPRGFSTDTQVDTGKKEFDQTVIIYTKYSVDNMPKEEQLISDLTEMLDVYRDYANWYLNGLETKEENKASHNTGVYDSWEIISESHAIKNCDLSFFNHNGSGVPKEIRWFWNADALQNGKRIDFTFCYEENQFAAHIERENSSIGRTRLFWEKNLGKKFAQYSKKDSCRAVFERMSDGLYNVKIECKMKEGGEEVPELLIKEQINLVKDYIASKGFSYDGELIENFYLSLKSKPFVILAGTSGTGKTRLVRLFAEAIGANYKLVSVRPDWSDSSDLFGHVNLKGEFVPGAIIDYIHEAAKPENINIPYFLCLDEMNLARVEYYLSDFLSIIETRHREDGRVVTDEIILDKAASVTYGKVILPENLYVIGTVNMDETTFPFSKKVLDRANTIEFSYVDLVPDFSEALEEAEAQNCKNDFLKTDYITLMSDTATEDRQFVSDICLELQEINEILQRAQAHVGYRVRDEIVFYMLNNKKAELLDTNLAFDNEIMQKILPRIQGSSASIKDMLCELFKKCAGDYTGLSQASVSEQMQVYVEIKDCKYKKSAEKICYMMRRFEEDGFTSYWL